MKKLLVSIVFSLPLALFGTEYYIDFEGGNNSNNGTTINTPWKHCPGDYDVSGNANITPAAGDVFFFKGGVSYRGNLRFDYGTVGGAPITLLGNAGWGISKAILNGATVLTNTWTNAINAADARGNPAYTNVWITVPPSHLITNGLGSTSNPDWFTLMFVGTNQFSPSQDKNPQNNDLMLWEDLPTSYNELPEGGAGFTLTQNFLSATNYFTNASALYYSNCYISVWVQGNTTEAVPITGYAPNSNTVFFTLSGIPYGTNRAQYFKILNNPAYIDYQYEYALQTNENRLYLYSTNDPNLLTIERGTKSSCFWTTAGKNVRLDGFTVKGSSGYLAINIGVGGGDNTNIVVANCDVGVVRGSFETSDAIAAGNSKWTTITNCTIHDAHARGLNIQGSGINVVSNHVYRVVGSGIAVGSYGNLIGNRVDNTKGVHGNGMSAYQVYNMLIEGNYVRGVNNCLAVSEQTNIWIRNNVFDSYPGNGVILENGTLGGGTNWIVNNILIGTPRSALALKSLGWWWVFNNLVDGGGIAPPYVTNCFGSHNNWFSLNAYQDTNALSSFDTYNTNYDAFFVSRATGDYTSLSNSPAIGIGTNFMQYFSNDFTMAMRAGSPTNWSMGAYESPSTNTPPVEPGMTETPTFSPGGGIFTNTVTVTASCPTAGATICYSLTGTATTNSSVYSAPLVLTLDTTISLIAFKAGLSQSLVRSATYTKYAIPSINTNVSSSVSTSIQGGIKAY